MKTKIELNTEKMDQTSLDYYRGQFEKLDSKTLISIKLTDFEGNQTNSMTFNQETLFELIQLFKKQNGVR